MAYDFLAGVSQNLLNNISIQVYPSIKDKLEISGNILQPAAALVQWNTSAAPSFDLSANDTQNFKINVPSTLTITPQGGNASSEQLNLTGSCLTSIDGSGNLRFSISDIAFNSADPFVIAFLNIKKQDIINLVANLLATINIPLGPVEGITFNGYATQIDNSVFYAAGSVSGGGAFSSPGIGGDLGLILSNTIMQTIVANQWWSRTPKSFRPNSDLTINLNSYGFDVAGNQMVLTLNLSGGYELDEGLGNADWSVSIDPVTVLININIDANNNVVLAGGSVSTPGVSFNPENFLATVTSIATGDLIGLIISQVISNDIPGTISSYLSGTIFTIPVLHETFQGISFSVAPTNLTLSVSNSQVVITGSAKASVG